MFTQWNPNERSALTKKATSCSGHKETLMLAIVGLLPIQINSFKVEKTFVNLYFTLYLFRPINEKLTIFRKFLSNK